MSSVSDGTFTKPIGNCIASSQISLLKDYHLLTLVMLMRPTRTSATPLLLQLKDLSHAVGERTTDPVGMLSVNNSTRPFFEHHKAKQLILLPQHCQPRLMISVESAGRRQSIPSTLHTSADWHGTASTNLREDQEPLVVLVQSLPTVLLCSRSRMEYTGRKITSQQDSGQRGF